ncbi:hypothetical protein ACIPWF_18395 [Paenarthrobacter sp. NPDC089989]|uniref:hypothetical protein n=1 Tax=unclassified Paenarthrobacter TaxID=2634190 RepID=UPI003816D4BD
MSITLQLPMTFRSRRRDFSAVTADHSFDTAARRFHTKPGEISASPWEGLYIEPGDETAEAVARTAQPNPELERFLAGLMYGE